MMIRFSGFCLLLILGGCISVGKLKGLYGYQEETERDFPGLLHPPTADVCTLKASEKPEVVVINGSQLKPCLEQIPLAMVYIWDPLCAGSYCYPPEAVQRFCNKRNITLFVVAEFYEGAKMNEIMFLKKPVFGIDSRYYKTNRAQKYIRGFLEDLKSPHAQTSGLLRFENGIYIQGVTKLEDF